MNERPTLAQHGLWYRLNFLAGMPIYDDEDGVIGYYVEEPRWREEDLTPADEAEVARLIEDQAGAGRDPLWLRWSMLDWLGVEHYHRKGRPVLDQRPAYGYECAMCKAFVIAKDPGDVPFRGGPVDGQWFVIPPDRQVWMFPVIQPLSVAAFDDEPRYPTTSTVIYERGRDGAFYYRR